MKQFIFALTCITLFACTPNKDKIGKVKSIFDVLESAEEILAQVDTTKAFSAYRDIRSKLLYVQENYKDTMDKPTALTLGDFHGMRKVLSYFDENYKEFEEEMEYSRSQLNDMISDLEANKMSEENFNKYYQTELDAVLDLNTRIQGATNNTMSTLEKYDARLPELNKIIDDLKAKTDTTAN